MTSPAPTVTVILATYGWSSVLPFSIGSVLHQSFADFELLVVGDGCTDDSENIVAAQADSRIRWINLPSNSGHQSAPNNEGLRQARGLFVAYLGHDDLWLPHHLSSMMAAFETGADLAYGLTKLVPAAGARDIVQVPVYRPGASIPPSCVAHRRSVTQTIGGWRDYRELQVDPEVDLWRRIQDAGYRMVFVPRLMAIKFPASWRRNVYRERPFHEQSHWLERIRSEDDIEAVELANMLATALRAIPDNSYRALLRSVIRETVRQVRRRLPGKERLPRRSRPGARIDANKRFKGASADSGVAAEREIAGQDGPSSGRKVSD